MNVTYKTSGRGEEHPAVFDDRTRTVAYHVFNIVIKSVCAFVQEMIEREKISPNPCVAKMQIAV